MLDFSSSFLINSDGSINFSFLKLKSDINNLENLNYNLSILFNGFVEKGNVVYICE